MTNLLAAPLRQWVEARAEAMGLPGADDYLLLLIRLDKQQHDLAVLTAPTPNHAA